MKEFFREHPEAKWKDALNFLLEKFPQITDGQIQYLIDGGAAVHLLHPEREEPKDIDILVRAEDLKENFSNALIIDAKTIKDWCANHDVPYSADIEEKIFSLGVNLNIDGRGIVIASPAFLALSKLLPWFGKSRRREKDASDLKILSVSPGDLDRLKKLLNIG